MRRTIILLCFLLILLTGCTSKEVATCIEVCEEFEEGYLEKNPGVDLDQGMTSSDCGLNCKEGDTGYLTDVFTAAIENDYDLEKVDFESIQAKHPLPT